VQERADQLQESIDDFDDPFQGSQDGSFSLAAPSGAPNASPVRPGGTNAVGQGSQPGPAMQERRMAAAQTAAMQSDPVAEFEAELIRQADGTPDPSPMSPVEKVREDMAFIAEFLWLTKPPYGQNETLDRIWGNGVPKCNKFSCDVGNIAGAKIRTGPNGGSPPRAADYAKGNVPGFDAVNPSDVHRGDLVAQQRNYSNASGHMGIVTEPAANGNHIVISARGNVSRDPLRSVFPPTYKSPIVYLRWVGIP
jgi:hypothetical protein